MQLLSGEAYPAIADGQVFFFNFTAILAILD